MNDGLRSVTDSAGRGPAPPHGARGTATAHGPQRAGEREVGRGFLAASK